LEEYLNINTDGTINSKLRDAIKEHSPDFDEEAMEAQINFEPHKDLCKRRFLWYYDSYLLSIAKNKELVTKGQNFTKMPFESSGNGMDGKFNYDELERRLKLIKKTLDLETDEWASKGLDATKREVGVAVNLQRQYEQTIAHYKTRETGVTLDIELENKNPFVWSITYFGRPMTNLDGGLFRLKIFFSPNFPEEQPRVKCETKIFHHKIAKDGTVCYVTKKIEDARGHVEAIIDALEEEHPPYDPRTNVNPEAMELFWGNAQQKKDYSRKLRRSVQDSME
jgi:ubiquitin-conjugating enzyme E2 Z